MEKEELIKKILEDSKLHAGKNGFKLNPDKNIVNLLVEGIAENEKNLGIRLCSCRIFAGDTKEDSICPCKWHKEEIKTKGRCHCGLFIKND